MTKQDHDTEQPVPIQGRVAFGVGGQLPPLPEFSEFKQIPRENGRQTKILYSRRTESPGYGPAICLFGKTVDRQ